MFGFGYTGIISSMKKLPSGASYGALTTAWIAATSETDTTIITALNTLETDLTTYGLTAKIKVLYPMVGGTATKHKFNFMDARDLDAAFRLTFNGGWTHSSTGALPNGTNAYADTYFIPLTDNIVNSSHMSFYSRTLVSEGKISMGCYGVAVASDYNQLAISFGGTSYCNPNNGGGVIAATFSSNSQGLFIASRTSATNVFGQRNAVQTTGTATTARNENSIYIGALHEGLFSSTYHSIKECAFASIGDGLTTTEASNFYTAVQAFQTTLSRQVI
jgi:hypothetical protein